jgi:predicted CopG family antitoxin
MILFFQILLGVGIAGFLIMVFRKIPVLLNYPRHPFEEISLKQKVVNKLKKMKENANQSDVLHNAIIPKTEKFLRKSKILTLKMDNFLARIAGRLKKKKQEKEESDNNDNNEEMPT